MGIWQVIIGPPSGGYDLRLLAATSTKLTAHLVSPSELTFEIDGRHETSTTLDELRSDIHLLFTPTDDVGVATGPIQPVFRGRVGPTSDTLDEDSHVIAARAWDYRAVLNRRRLYTGDTLTYTTTDQSLIAWNLIDATQGKTGGAMGIIRGTGQTTGINRSRTFEVRASIGEEIQKLSEVPDDGFDWDVEPDGSSVLKFNVYYPTRGSDKGVILQYGSLISKLTRDVDPADYANAIQVTGDDGLTAAVRTATDISTVLQGRWDAVIGDTSILTQAALDDRANWLASEMQVIQPAYTIHLRRGEWQGPGHIWLGDTVRAIIFSGRLAVDTLLRVYDIAIDVLEDGGEDVTLTLGGPRPDFRRKSRDIFRRLNTLERR